MESYKQIYELSTRTLQQVSKMVAFADFNVATVVTHIRPLTTKLGYMRRHACDPFAVMLGFQRCHTLP